MRRVNLPSIILRRVNLSAVSSDEIFDQFFHNLSLPGSLGNGLKYFWFWLRIIRIFRKIPSTLHRHLKGQCHKNKIWIFILLKRATFWIFAKKGERLHLLTPRSIILRGVSFFYTKIRITQQKFHWNRKYLNPLVSGPGWFEWWKKPGGWKSRWTVPLKHILI